MTEGLRLGCCTFWVLVLGLLTAYLPFSSFDLVSGRLVPSLPVSFSFSLFLFASVLLRWLRCCSSVWQPSYFWGIPWVWRGASIRFSPSLYKPSGLDGRQSVRRGYCGCQRRRIRVSCRWDLGKPQTCGSPKHWGLEFLHFPNQTVT